MLLSKSDSTTMLPAYQEMPGQSAKQNPEVASACLDRSGRETRRAQGASRKMRRLWALWRAESGVGRLGTPTLVLSTDGSVKEASGATARCCWRWSCWRWVVIRRWEPNQSGIYCGTLLKAWLEPHRGLLRPDGHQRIHMIQLITAVCPGCWTCHTARRR